MNGIKAIKYLSWTCIAMSSFAFGNEHKNKVNELLARDICNFLACEGDWVPSAATIESCDRESSGIVTIVNFWPTDGAIDVDLSRHDADSLVLTSESAKVQLSSEVGEVLIHEGSEYEETRPLYEISIESNEVSACQDMYFSFRNRLYLERVFSGSINSAIMLAGRAIESIAAD